ncbi:unnamed protein product [Rotaria sordida]|uniref:TMEM131L fifth Ig-like domain-containing protein n=1 Tax=Rotaria sordida TaxID=392033 RepID=A0A819JHV9_9BILA|nr:unnamed protein product [Rotaria sordida]
MIKFLFQRKIVKPIFDKYIFSFKTSKQIKLINGIYNFNLLSNDNIVFTVSYQPTLSMRDEMYLIVRNNLTIIESILLRGEGGIGSLQVGNRQAGSSLVPIILKIDEKQRELCSNSKENPLLRKVVTLRNTGNMKTIIHDISFGHSKCFRQGFSVSVCTNIEIEPNEKYDLKILFQPDYTSDEINETLILNTNTGLMTFPIIVRIPQRVLLSCYKTIQRPPWELRTYGLCFCSFFLFIIVIFATAVYEARRLFDNYLTRAEWRNRMQMTNNQIFDLSDLSLAVQDEQKSRERIGSNSTTDTKKEKIIETSKNEFKRKRSITSNNENEDKLLKIIQASDESNTSLQSTGLSPKPILHKPRRATTDSSHSSKFSKPQQETLPKKQPLQRRKSDQHTSATSPKATSSTTVSEEENEPFLIARSRRISNKAKESSTNITSQSTIDNTVATKQKPSVYSHQQELLQLDDSTNDQQWHRVSSNKGQRSKGTTIRRETVDESQSTNKMIKVSSTNSENPRTLSSSSSSHKHNSVSHETTQSHYHPSRHRSARDPSTTPVPILTEKKSLPLDTSLIATNRELTLRQLTEHLWTTRLPSSRTACSMSIRSRCSSAPTFECGGVQNKATKTGRNDSEKVENIDWDEPDMPDEDFGRYASQTEYSIDELNNINERTQTQRNLTTNNIPSLMSLSIAPPIITKNIQDKSITSSSVIKENIEPLPFPQHGLGPIQRPNKLPCPSTTQSSSFLSDSIQSPSTPDVLVQINHLLDHSNSITTMASTPNVPILTDSSTMINEISTPNVSWTPFSPTEWSSKYDSSWPTTNLQSPNISLIKQIQNPFLQQQQQQQQISNEESSVWSSALGTATSNSVSSSAHTQPTSEWHELFSSNVPSSTQITKSTNNSWLKFFPVSDPSPVDSITSNRQENETNNPFWNLINSNETQQNSSASWWPKTSSYENNNDNDQSRWDFAR